MTGYLSSKFRHKCEVKGCYVQHLPSWDDLIDCFPRKIRPTDIDGMVEINGHFLFLEEKNAGAGPDDGQRIALLKLSKVKNVTVVFFRPKLAGQNELLEVLIFDGTPAEGWQTRTREWLKDWLRTWSDNAEHPARRSDDMFDVYDGEEFE